MLWEETQNHPETRQSALIGLRKYQEALRHRDTTDRPIHAAQKRAKIHHLGTDGSRKERTPIVLVPSLVNPPSILDLSSRKSLARFLAAQGHDPWLVDWGTPGPEDAMLDLAGHVEQLLLPLLATLDHPPILVGYCLGGTLALAAAGPSAARAVVTVATPWDFTGYPDTERERLARLWNNAKEQCERLGYVPMEVLQSGFWALDPARTIRKYAHFAQLDEASEAARAFVTVEDWANDGPPLTWAAARDLFVRFYSENATGTGSWDVMGSIVDPAALACPTLSIRSTTDRIVPAAAAPILQERLDLGLGHVGMIVSDRAPATLWEPLSAWLSKWDRCC
nr:alpha/beta fold hydrolase [Sphingobium subterraneum]